VRLLAFLLALPLLTGCAPVLVAAGVGAAGGYAVGKHYDIKVKSPIEVEKER